MWDMFVIAVAAGSVLLYLPGFLLLRGCRVRGLTALACAPLVTLPMYLAACILFEKAGVFSSWLAVAGPAITLGAAAFAVGSFAGRGRALRFGVGYSPDGPPCAREGRWPLSDGALLGLYAAGGIVVASLCFAFALDGPESFVQGFDNVHHLNVTRAFVDSGNWSPFCVSQYLTEADEAINPLPGASYYPAAWNVMAALLVSALGISTALAGNAVNFLFAGIVYPLGMFLLMKAAFPKAPGVVAFGALCVLGFSAFPWMLMVLGPLYPNMLGFCLVPAVAFCFMGIFSCGVGWQGRAASIVLLALGVLCCAFTQPNAVFTTAILLAPFCVRQSVRLVDHAHVPSSRIFLAKAASACAACALVVAAWYALYKMPFLQSVVTYTWPPTDTRMQALVDAVSLGFRAPGAQVALAGLIVLGALHTLRDREHVWLTCSYAIAVLIYVVSVSSDGQLQHLLSGFWYTDSARIAASAAIIGVPLASMGLWAMVGLCRFLVERTPLRKAIPASATAWCALAVSCGFVLANYYPGFVLPGQETKQTALCTTLSQLRGAHEAQAPGIYSADERSFVEEALRVIPPGSLVVNVPDDGSALSYGLTGMRTYYRYLRPYGSVDETEESRLIRSRLNAIATDERVREAVGRVGGAYVLALDQGPSRLHSPRWYTYMNGATWRGIELVEDETPGFEVVLADGDKRLYRIVAKGE